MVLKTFERRRRVKEKITGKIGNNIIKTVNYVFNNQIEYLLPVNKNDLTLLAEEMKNK